MTRRKRYGILSGPWLDTCVSPLHLPSTFILLNAKSNFTFTFVGQISFLNSIVMPDPNADESDDEEEEDEDEDDGE